MDLQLNVASEEHLQSQQFNDASRQQFNDSTREGDFRSEGQN